MKITFTISLLCLSLLLSSQNPQPYPVSNVSWSVVNVFPMGGWPPVPGMMTVTFGYYGFKEVGGYEYSQLFHTHEPDFIPGDENTYFSGYVREEDGYVMLLRQGSDEIDTLYNFNLQAGEQATNFKFCCGVDYPVILNYIDSTLVNGEYRRRFVFDTIWDYTSYMAEVWIEGIGSVHGTLFPNEARLFNSEIPDALSLSCFSYDSQLIWQNPEFDQCYMNTLTSVYDPAGQALSLFPNPAAEFLTIQLEAAAGSTTDIRIYNLNGNVIKSKTVNSFGSQVTILMEGIKPGLYFVEVINGNKRFIKRFVRL
jgi:hypothetical protein